VFASSEPAWAFAALLYLIYGVIGANPSDPQRVFPRSSTSHYTQRLTSTAQTRLPADNELQNEMQGRTTVALALLLFIVVVVVAAAAAAIIFIIINITTIFQTTSTDDFYEGFRWTVLGTRGTSIAAALITTLFCPPSRLPHSVLWRVRCDAASCHTPAFFFVTATCLVPPVST
jgi:hypothetical protein